MTFLRALCAVCDHLSCRRAVAYLSLRQRELGAERDACLADPKHFVPGNPMPYSLLMGAENGKGHQYVIAYLHTLQ